MKKNICTGFFLAAVISFSVSGAHAQIYRCANGQGGTSFSDKPCIGGKQDVVDMRYKTDKRETPKSPEATVDSSAASAKPEVPNVAAKPSPAASESSATPAKPAAPTVPLEDRLAALCVDQYRPHLAYPQGVRIISRTLERRLDEMVMTVLVRTITNNSTPAALETITLTEKFICVTDGGSGLNLRSTGMYVNRHKGGQRL